jgi:hypothetical protein
VAVESPEYWRGKAVGFRRLALRAARGADAAILIRRAEEFERMAALMEAERAAPAAAPRDTALDNVVSLGPSRPAPAGPPGPVYVARRAQRLARPYIARRAQRLVR